MKSGHAKGGSLTPFTRINLAIVIAMTAVVLVWGYAAGFVIDRPARLWAGLFLALIFGVPGLVYTYVRSDPVVSVPLLNFALVQLYFLVGSMLSYIVASLNFPLIDPWLAGFDKSIGFDWLAVLTFFNDRAWLDDVMNRAYNIPFVVTVLSLLYLTFTGRHRQVEDFTICMTLTGLVTLLLSGTLPAVGAFPYYLPAESAHDQISVFASYSHLDQLLGLRDGSFRSLLTDEPRGLATFPSFHTIYALILIYAMRGTGIFFLISVLINSATIASTPIFGGHYFVDLIGGFVVAGGVVVVVKMLRIRFYGEGALLRRDSPATARAVAVSDTGSRRIEPAADAL